MALQVCGQAQLARADLQRRELVQTRTPAASQSVSAPLKSSFYGRSRSVAQSSFVSSQSKGTPKRAVTVCGIDDFIGGDLIGFDLGQWCDEVEQYGAIGFYAPPEGGAECRYASSLKYRGYHFMNISARGLGDPEAYLLKPHGVRPAHLGKQAVARFYYPGEVDYRLSILPPRYKGIVLWVGEGKVLSKNELQFLALLPALRPQVKVVVEMGGSRKFNWKPLKDIVGLSTASKLYTEAASPLPEEMKKTAEPAKEKEAVAS